MIWLLSLVVVSATGIFWFRQSDDSLLHGSFQFKFPLEDETREDQKVLLYTFPFTSRIYINTNSNAQKVRGEVLVQRSMLTAVESWIWHIYDSFG